MSQRAERQAACLRAVGYAKPTKREIVEYVNELIDGDGPLDERLIGLIWLYFERRPTQRAAKDVRYWVAQAAYTGDDREWMRYVRAEPGKLVATDGHRMHVADAGDVVSTGFRDPTTMLPVDPGDITFPPYEQVIPPPDLQGRTEKALTDFEPEGKDVVRLGEALLDRRYVREAYAGSETLLVSARGPLYPVRFDSLDGTRIAVVMPRRT